MECVHAPFPFSVIRRSFLLTPPSPSFLSMQNKQAVRRGSTVVGIQGKDCVVLAVEKRAIAKYVHSRSFL
jgi:20S proteasome subunit alpha 4